MAKHPRKSNGIDRHVATRLRAARLQADLSQDEVGQELGISFQQLQKYENGVNRIAAGRLYQLASLYGVPVGWFFDGVTTEKSAKPTEDTAAKLLATPHGIDLARHYIALPGNPSRQLVIDIAQALARTR